MKSHTHQYNYSQITPLLYLGTNFCCQAAFDADLLEKGITADVSLEEERVDQPYGVKYYLWLPTKDHFPPNLRQLHFGARAIDFFIRRREKVYVHCRLGHGRSPTLVVAYFLFSGLPLYSAIQRVKNKRPEIHLEKRQIMMLKRFENLLRKRGKDA